MVSEPLIIRESGSGSRCALEKSLERAGTSLADRTSRSTLSYRARLVSEVDLPVIDLPFLFAEEFGFAELRALAQRLTRPALSTRRSGRA